MASFTCHCGQPLTIHCGNPDCDWWTCRDKACDCDVFDVTRGTLRHNDGAVERL